jgi:UPF0755 protein
MISILKKFFLLGLLVAFVLSMMIWLQYQKFVTEPLNVAQQGVIYEVKSGSNLASISSELTELGLSSFPKQYFYYYGRFLGKANYIKAGQYRILPNTTLPELLEQFIKGDVIQYPFTIIEGMTAQQVFSLIQLDSRFTHTLKNTSLDDLMTMLGHEGINPEGQFAPETYYFSANSSDFELLKRANSMMTEFLSSSWENRADNLPYNSPYEALIMASIIEKETGIAEERAQIAGVFVRRLNKGMRLQTDPTVIYGLGDEFNGNLRKHHLRTDTVYNTYTRYGLPPSPIALPSKEAIVAALHPKDGTSLYFVATGKEGRHVFSNTLKAHNQAVRKYQLKK